MWRLPDRLSVGHELGTLGRATAHLCPPLVLLKPQAQCGSDRQHQGPSSATTGEARCLETGQGWKAEVSGGRTAPLSPQRVLTTSLVRRTLPTSETQKPRSKQVAESGFELKSGWLRGPCSFHLFLLFKGTQRKFGAAGNAENGLCLWLRPAP